MSRISKKNVFKQIYGRNVEHELGKHTIKKETVADKFIIDDDIYKVSSRNNYRELSVKNILVIGLMRNIQKDLKCLKFFINELKSLFKTVSFFYLTNNNTDDTIKVMKEWTKEDKDIQGIIIDNESVDIVTPNGDIGNRVHKLATYRNMLFKEAKDKFGCNYDYMLQIDTDLISEITAERFATCFNLKEEFDIICANAVFKNSFYHYDVFALRLLVDPNNIKDIYPLFSQYYGLRLDWVSKMYIFKTWTKVKSAWGGMMLFPSKIFKLDKLYDEKCPIDECEHISLCRKFSNIYINPHLMYMQEYHPEGQCYKEPLLFIPRDAGFFSVFNFYIGMLTMCGRVYPYWNYNQFVVTNKGKPQHFCYFNKDNDNCWFDFFKPVEFYLEDKTHNESIINKKFNITQGCEAPEEFRIPCKSQALLNNTNGDFSEWRHKVNRVFKMYIKLSPILDNLLNDIVDKLFIKTNKMIGVHFRHPSHCCEQGIILLEDYFKKIDEILEFNKDAGIYLATDTEFGIAAFQRKYGSRLGYIEGITRTSMDNLLEWAYARGVANSDGVGFINNKGYELQHVSSRENEGGDPTLGYDVLLDVFCLGECDWFIHTVSNLSLAVSYINPDIEMIIVK
jgi:hypothetical protein